MADDLNAPSPTLSPAKREGGTLHAHGNTAHQAADVFPLPLGGGGSGRGPADLTPTPSATKILRTFVAQPADTITLTHDRRHRRRIALTSDNGIAFLLNLEEATLLREGDMLQLDDGRSIRVKAKKEPLMEVHGSDPIHMLKLAWHIGNRHLEAEISADRILLRRDHVIADMLHRLGANVRDVEAPFNPEGGAYGGHGHAHHHGHDHGR